MREGDGLVGDGAAGDAAPGLDAGPGHREHGLDVLLGEVSVLGEQELVLGVEAVDQPAAVPEVLEGGAADPFEDAEEGA